MFGPQRDKPCPMCMAFMNPWVLKMQDVQQNVSFIFVARSPIARLIADAPKRGIEKLPLFSDTEGDFTRTYVSKEDEDTAGLSVFVRRNGKIHHFWSEEISSDMADPGQDPRGAANFDPLWDLLDLTPNGRKPDWYPELEYK